jgi:dehydrogenase/reductase SDR family protein 12
MYNTKFPLWEDATSTGNNAYDGQFAYAYAKRGQVLLCERWSEKYPKVKIVSCHPGWTLTGGVEAAYGDKKSYLEPLRTLWQGSEGIVWLAVADAAQIDCGAFYLDRSPQIKHIAG